MAEGMRFRPVLFGPPERPSDALYALEEPDGRAFFRAFEFCWPLDVSLEAITVDDLPSPYHGRYRADVFPVTILPVQEVAGKDHHEAFKCMLGVLRKLRTKGVTALRKSA